MVLKELNLGDEAKISCASCQGTGVYKNIAKYGDLGTVCTYCNGSGFHVIKINKNNKLFQDEETGVVYRSKNGIIGHTVKLFSRLEKREDITYVIYPTSIDCSPKQLFETGASEICIITYKEFYNGMLPMPMMQYTCPKEFSHRYRRDEFNCYFNSFSDCNSFGHRECWDEFYGEAKTIKEKQAVLRKIK